MLDRGDQVSAMERNSSQVTFISGQEELQRILSARARRVVSRYVLLHRPCADPRVRPGMRHSASGIAERIYARARGDADDGHHVPHGRPGTAKARWAITDLATHARVLGTRLTP
jgi:hypothetical protein